MEDYCRQGKHVHALNTKPAGDVRLFAGNVVRFSKIKARREIFSCRGATKVAA
jgi:hypothetical protein